MSDTALLSRVRRRLADGPAVLDLPSAVRAETPAVDASERERVQREVAAEISGAGLLEPLLQTPGVTDVLVNSPDEVWVDRGAGLARAPVRFADDRAVRALAQRLATAAGRRLDDACPCVDAVLPGGVRMHAVLPPVAAHPTISLRVIGRRRWAVADLAAAGALPPDALAVALAVVAARVPFLISGGTGTGKTTLLGALLSTVPANERILTIEDAPELPVEHPHAVRLVCRPPNAEGAGAIGFRELVRQALRMRPDRVVVGEFRGAEMAELLVALNTGHDGGAATVHANSGADVPARLIALGALAGWSVEQTSCQVAAALRVVLHLGRDPSGARGVSEIVLLGLCEGALTATGVWTRTGGRGPAWGALSGLLASRGARL